jgi:hypothetical protein
LSDAGRIRIKKFRNSFSLFRHPRFATIFFLNGDGRIKENRLGKPDYRFGRNTILIKGFTLEYQYLQKYDCLLEYFRPDFGEDYHNIANTGGYNWKKTR